MSSTPEGTPARCHRCGYPRGALPSSASLCPVCGAGPGAPGAVAPPLVRLRGPGRLPLVYAAEGILALALVFVLATAVVPLAVSAVASGVSSASASIRAAIATAQARPTPSPKPTALAIAPTAPPTPTSPAASPTPVPAPPSPTAAPPTATPSAYLVANTGGDGVYLRRAPGSDERIKAWPDRTRLTVAGADRQVGGKTWRNVKDPDGNVGWVLADYLEPVAGGR